MSFVREWSVRATRKEHRCDGCGQPIPKGQPAVRWSGMTDGDFGSAVYHPDCREAEIARNRAMDNFGDDWCQLDECVADGGEEWLRHEYPAVAKRLCGPVKTAEAAHG